MRTYALLTHVMHEAHLEVLQDWVDFLRNRPQQLVVFTGRGIGLKDAIERFCASNGIALRDLGEAPVEMLKADETDLVLEQVRDASTHYVIHVRLDTLPFRVGEDNWLDRVLAALDSGPHLFFTGSTLPYRADEAIGDAEFSSTARVSNNFLIMDRSEWMAIQGTYRELRVLHGRYYTEACIEHHCQRTGARGIRKLNSATWRVFHTQAWDERMQTVRKQFRSGRGVAPFLSGYQDDVRHPWEEHFGHPRPSLARRMRIRLGAVRRAALRFFEITSNRMG